MMKVAGVNLFVYRPLLRVSAGCQRLFSATWEKFKAIEQVKKIQVFASSILGRVIVSTTAELVGSTIGAVIGSVLLTRVSSIARQCGIERNPSKDNYYVEAWIGSQLGALMGGYAALIIVRSKTIFWQREKPSDCYLVCTIKFVMAGEVFDAIIVNPQTPLIGPILRIVRFLIKAPIQALAFNSSSSIPFIKDCLKRRRVSQRVFLPFCFQMLTKGYTDNNSQRLAEKFANLIVPSWATFPTVLQKGLTLVKQKAIEPKIRARIEALGENGDLLATIAMRSFLEYNKRLNGSKEIQAAARLFQKSFEQLELPLKATEIFSHFLDEEFSHGDSSVFGIAFDTAISESSLNDFIDSLVTGVRGAEFDLVGSFQLNNQKVAYLKAALPIYLRSYLLFTFQNYKQFTTGLTPTEELTFLLDLNNAFISTYFASVLPSGVTLIANTIMGVGISSIYGVKLALSSSIVELEQTAIVIGSSSSLIDTEMEPPQNPAKEEPWEKIEEIAEFLASGSSNVESIGEGPVLNFQERKEIIKLEEPSSLESAQIGVEISRIDEQVPLLEEYAANT